MEALEVLDAAPRRRRAGRRLVTDAGHMQLPSIGLGLAHSGEPNEIYNAIKEAVACGYRLLDGAASYGNEREVGQAIADVINEGVVTREELWVVSKLPNTHHCWHGDSHRPAKALAKTLDDLQLSSLDLYLMHWPIAIEQEDVKAAGGQRLTDTHEPNPKLNLEIEYLDTWREMVALKEQGLVKHIGVANFTMAQLMDLLAQYPDCPPEVNQVELHPYLAQPEMMNMCREKGIALMAYSPLGSGDGHFGASFPKRGTGAFECAAGGGILLQNEIVCRISQRKGCSPAQVLVAWSVAHGFTCLPKSVSRERIMQNFAALQACKLSELDLEELSTLNCGFRYGIGYLPGHFDCPNAPWFAR